MRGNCVIVAAMKRGSTSWKRPVVQRVAVVYKPTEPEGWPADHRRRRAQREHRRTLDAVVATLSRLELSCDLIERFRGIPEDRYDLVVTVGGDGTVLTTAHRVKDAPVLAINSAPQDSEGFLTAADRNGFLRLLRSFLSGQGQPGLLRRLELVLNGRRIPELVLNDVLIAEANPAMISRYALTVGGRTEEQRSSGVWVATAAGSTAAIRSAGGRALPLRSSRFQYIVREPYVGRGRRQMRLDGGCLGASAALGCRSLMHRGTIFVDGAHVRYPFHYGDRLVVRATPEPLRMVGIRR